MTRPQALIVDDEPDIRELLDITLQRMNIATSPAGSLAEARQQLQRRHFDLCLADMRLPDGDGIDIVRHLAEHHPDTPVAMITAHGNMDSAIEALKAGAFDFVSKPVELGVLRRLVETALRLRDSQPALTSEESDNSGPQLLGRSPAIAHVKRLIAKLARSQAPVFVTGESGTGKELAARLIHLHGPRHDKPFVPVNCGAIPGELMESELFGHIKGSFTGAVRDKAGLFQAADGGTLFLDEVAELPLHMQVKLLRAIQEKCIRPVGGASEIPVDVRLVSASHRNIALMVEQGTFRQDLYYRLHVIELAMPPLRGRTEDIPLLVEHLLTRISASSGIPKPSLSEEASETLRQYNFPGNVRELENLLERACALCEDGIIHTQDLGLDSYLHAENKAAPLPPGDLETHLADIEREILERTLESTRWNRKSAAAQLGLTLRSLRYRMEKLGLGRDEGFED